MILFADNILTVSRDTRRMRWVLGDIMRQEGLGEQSWSENLIHFAFPNVGPRGQGTIMNPLIGIGELLPANYHMNNPRYFFLHFKMKYATNLLLSCQPVGYHIDTFADNVSIATRAREKLRSTSLIHQGRVPNT